MGTNDNSKAAKIPPLQEGMVFPDKSKDQIQSCLDSDCMSSTEFDCTECLFDQEKLPEFIERNQDGTR